MPLFGVWSRSLRIAATATVAGLLALGSAAAERRAIITDESDYFGRDIETLKDVPLEECERACVADEGCKAFTYNTKARWCFLKADFGDLRPFPGATSGRIVEGPVAGADLEALRLAELEAIVGADSLDRNNRFLAEISGLPVAGTLAEAEAEAARRAMSGDLVGAVDAYLSAVRLAPERYDLWVAMAGVASKASHDDWSIRSQLADRALFGSMSAYLRAVDDDQRADALNLLAAAFARQENWRQAIKATRAVLAARPDEIVAAELEQLIAQHGFRVTDTRVDTAAAEPYACAVFSDPIAASLPNITDFVSVSGGETLAVEADDGQICVHGLEFGKRYAMTLRQGLPAADGEEALHKSVDLEFYVRDRDPQIRFLGKAYVLPRHADATIPVASVNVDVIEAAVVRVGDRGLATLLQSGEFLQQMGSWQVSELADRRGEAVWRGTVEVARETNREVTTAIPVGEVVKTLEPGVYAMTARTDVDDNDWADRATQWFIVSDLGMTAMRGNDGLHVILRSLGSADPVTGATLTLVASNNEILGTARTDADGYARFDAGLTRGAGGNAPAMVTAGTDDGDYAFLDLGRPAFDLTDRGVSGREAPRPVDVFVTTERGIYRAGETVHVTALLRDAVANAAADLPMTLSVVRPDGVEAVRRQVADAGAGGRSVSFDLPASAMRGAWRAQVFTDPKGPALAEVGFLVEDFLPERIDFAFDPGEEPLVSGATRDVEVVASWLYGAPAANLVLEGEVYVTRADGLPSAPAYRFGLEDEEFTPVAEPIGAPATDADGRSLVTLTVPDVSAATVPLQAAVHVRVLDTNGRPVERRRTLPVVDDRVRIGVDPQFDGSVDEGGEALFHIAAFDAAGAEVEARGLAWTLHKVDTRYQWYRDGGYWDYRMFKTTTRVASGTIDAPAGGFQRLAQRIDWGEYRLEVSDPSGGAIPVSHTFQGGWYVPPSADPAPDLLKVSLDKPRYAVGDTVTARIHPRFPGIAVVSVVDDRLIDMRVVEVGDDGATVSLPVTDAWGPGAYVTAQLIRPMDLPAGRMPQRALGLAHAEVDPGDRLLDVELSAPAEMRPRGPLDVEIDLANLAPGEEAFVTVAAVDAGILNMTGFRPPAPEDWYFARRRLGMEFRDLYGMLIDTTVGSRGVVRSGGDGSGIARLLGPPPTEKLVAFFEGVTRVDAEGRARVRFDIPEFNGTVRVMAIAWSRTGVGHAAADVLVRDPVVVQAALPNFLAPGDTSRLRLDVTHVDGPSGAFRVTVASAGGHVDVDATAAERTIELAGQGSAEVLVPLVARTIGDDTITVTLAGPDGTMVSKTLTLPVRANEPPVVRRSEFTLAANGGRLQIDRDLVADFVPGTARATVTVGGVGGIDLPGLVRSLDRYPYGCAEQITSRALPLVYLDEVVLASGLSDDTPVRERVQKAVEDVLSNQAANGSFGLWGPDFEGRDLWLNAYVTDFLTRAKEKGYDVPAVAFDLAVTNLKNRMAYAQDFETGGEAEAYALYVLARNGRAAIGDLRYFAQSKLEAFATPLAKAQIGAALALYGDRETADRAFRSALDSLSAQTGSAARSSDYGSSLRDGAAILTLASETRSESVDLDLLSRTVRRQSEGGTWLSTQEQAWMLLAAHSLLTDGRKPILKVNGAAFEGVYTGRFGADDLSAPVLFENVTGYDTEAGVTVAGVPVTPEAAGGRGYAISRRYFDLDGTEVDIARVPLGMRVAVVLTVEPGEESRGGARLMVDDPLPAGLVIDNPNVLTSADAANLSWLTLTEQVERAEFRSDRFLAAVTNSGEVFSVGYIARAVAPGDFAHPSAIVEDMYAPYLRARTGAGRMAVEGPVR